MRIIRSSDPSSNPQDDSTPTPAPGTDEEEPAGMNSSPSLPAQEDPTGVTPSPDISENSAPGSPSSPGTPFLDRTALERARVETARADHALAKAHATTTESATDVDEPEFLDALLHPQRWSSETLRTTAATLGLLPHAAVDHVNAASRARTGRPVLVEVDGGFELNPDVAKDTP